MLSRALWTGLAIARFATAQGDLGGLLATQPDLSILLDAVSAVPGLNQTLSTSSEPITIFAPINSAFDILLQQDVPEAAAVAERNSTTIEALLVRHVFKGYFTSDLISNTPVWIESMLTPEYRNDVQPFGNITGGANAGVVLNGGDVEVISGELTISTVTEADIRLGENIVIHKVDRVLAFGPPVTLYAARSGYSTFQGAVDSTGLSQALDIGLADITVFIPVNEAFNAIGSVLATADQATLTSVLQYHVIPDNIAYSTELGNVTVPTLNGAELTISVTPDGDIFVNQAKVIFANVLTGNGVAHVIDSVLNPVPFDRAQLDAIASLPAAQRTGFPGATPSATVTFSQSSAPIASSASDPIGDFTVSTDTLYSTPELLLTLDARPTALFPASNAATATATATSGQSPSPAAFTGAAAPAARPVDIVAGLAAVAGVIALA